jgi:HD superfamily phosphohydrolase YqeK
MDTKTIIELAVKELRTNPYDELHGEKHHKLVWENCRKILKEEKLKVDKDVLKISSMWHDVQRSQKDEFKLLKKTLKNLKVDKNIIGKILAVVESHSYGKKQISLEAKVLFDADKLEYVNFQRVLVLLEEYNKGKITQDRFDYYVKIWRDRINMVKNQLHFKFSKKVFESRLKKFLKLASGSKKLEAFTKGIVV